MELINALSDNIWAQLALAGVVLTVIASLFDRRRSRRHDIDAVGFMPWPAITVLSAMLALIAAAIAIIEG